MSERLTVAECLPAVLPVGRTRDGGFQPLGAGVLFIDSPLVWLLTARSLVEAAGDAPLGAYISPEREGTVVDLTTGRRGTPLDWLRDPEHDVAACLFPIDPSWPIKAFPEARCVDASLLGPATTVASVSLPWGLPGSSGPPPRVVLPGTLTHFGPHRLLTTAPLLPLNVGAPLVLCATEDAGGGLGLVGLLTRTLVVPEPPGSPAPPVRMAEAVPIEAAVALVRSDAGKAQRRLAIESSRSAPQAGQGS